MAQRILTVNGGPYHYTALAIIAMQMGSMQRFTQPYRPQTNGTSNRFIRTLLTGVAYATACGRSGWRTRALHPCSSVFTYERCHSALNERLLASRLPAVL